MTMGISPFGPVFVSYRVSDGRDFARRGLGWFGGLRVVRVLEWRTVEK